MKKRLIDLLAAAVCLAVYLVLLRLAPQNRWTRPILTALLCTALIRFWHREDRQPPRASAKKPGLAEVRAFLLYS